MSEPGFDFDVEGAARRALESLEAWEPETDEHRCDRALLIAAMRRELGKAPPPHLEAMRSSYIYGLLTTGPYTPALGCF